MTTRAFENDTLIKSFDQNLANFVLFQKVRFPNGQKEVLFITKNTNKYLGFSEEEFRQNPNILIDHTLTKYAPELILKQEYAMTTLSGMEYDFEFQKPNGHIIWLNMRLIPEKQMDGRIIINGVITDITDKRLQELKQLKINHELKTLNNINYLILNTKSEILLYDKICKNLVISGGYVLAWIYSKREPQEVTQRINPITAHGEISYLGEIQTILKNNYLKSGPIATAINTGKTTITNDCDNSTHFKPWAMVARNHRISATIVIPFKIFNDTYTLNIYSHRLHAFDEHEVSVLDKIVKNLVHAIESIRVEEEKKRYYYQLNERIKELRTTYNIYQLLTEEKNKEIIFETLVNRLVEGWQYPEHCVATLTINKQKYTSRRITKILASQKEKFILSDGSVGEIEIGYTKKFPPSDIGPFLKEEQELLKNICLALTIHLNKHIALAELESSKSNLVSVIENTNVGYVLLDTNCNIIMMNHHIVNCALFSPKKTFKIGNNFTNNLLPEKKQLFEKAFNHVLTNGGSFEYESHYSCNNEDIYYLINLIPVYDSNQKIINLNLSIKDITKSKQHDLMQTKITDDLVDRNRDLEQFSFMVSHNLRGPLVNLLGLSEIIHEENNEEERQFIAKSLKSSATRLDTVIKDLNEILKTKNNRESVFTEINLEVLVNDLTEHFNLNEQHITFNCSFSNLKYIHTNKAYLESILHNLISNAIKYKKPEEDPIISIFTIVTDSHFEIHIKDNGLGIDLERNGESIFKLYHRAHQHVEGRGMGLFMVKTQMNILGGTIEILSRINEGSEFILKFPFK